MLQCTGGWHGRWTKRGKWCEMLNRYFVAAWIVNKQLICLMLKICNYKHVHEIWEFDLRHGKFWIINCQHNIGASKRLIVDRLYTDETKKNDLQTWTSFLDWSSSHSQLNDISTIFNLSNNLDVFTPTIMNDVMHTCKIWEPYKDYQSADPTTPPSWRMHER
jgi:hypothetical protein